MPSNGLGAVDVGRREVVVLPNRHIGLGLVEADNSDGDGCILNIKAGLDLTPKRIIENLGKARDGLLEGA